MSSNRLPNPLDDLPSGKTVKIYIIAANDAGQAQPGDTVQILVP
jgi:hypothetical protein